MGVVTTEIESRSRHSDPTVREIATALLEFRQNRGQSWVDQVMEKCSYQSSLQAALLMEKIVLHSVLADLWTGVMTAKPEDQEAEAARHKQCIARKTDKGWLEVVASIPETVALKQTNKPIQTHRLPRYKNLIKEIILPRTFGEVQTVVDAGSSLGAGSHLAGELGWPVKRWWAVDLADTGKDLPWVLSCSFRFGEIFQPDFVPTLRKYLTIPEYTKKLTGDMQNLSIKDDFIDVYLAVFSHYQLPNPDKAFLEARRVTRPGGLILVTDYFAGENNQLTGPGGDSQIATKIWQKDNRGNVKLVDTQVWRDTDLNK